MVVIPLLVLGMMGAESPGCDRAKGGHPQPAQHDPKPLRTGKQEAQKTYLMRIEVKQFYPQYIYISHQMGAYRDLEEEWNETEWWTEQRVVPGTKLWIHVTKPRGSGITTCKIYYIPGRGLGWRERRSRTIVGPGSCDAVYYVTHREESEI